MTSKKRAHAMVNLVKNPSQPAQYNKVFEDNPRVKSDEFMTSFIKDNDIKNTTVKVSCFNVDIEGFETFNILQNDTDKISCLDIDIDAIETFEIVQTGTGTTSNNDGDCNTINILQTSTAELTTEVSYTYLNVDDIEMNSDITNDPSNKKNLKKRPTAMENRMFGQNYTGFQMIYYKLDFKDTCYLPLTLPRNKHFELIEHYPKLYAKQIPLTLSKWTDLQKLKHVLPVDTHAFYDSLPHADTLKQRKHPGI